MGRKRMIPENQLSMGFISHEFSMVAEDGKMRIRDGVGYFRDSCVRYTHFTQYDIRLMFAYFRAKEEIFQQDALRKKGDEKAIATVRLHLIENILCFMASNFRFIQSESEPDNKWGHDFDSDGNKIERDFGGENG